MFLEFTWCVTLVYKINQSPFRTRFLEIQISPVCWNWNLELVLCRFSLDHLSYLPHLFFHKIVTFEYFLRFGWKWFFDFVVLITTSFKNYTNHVKLVHNPYGVWKQLFLNDFMLKCSHIFVKRLWSVFNLRQFEAILIFFFCWYFKFPFVANTVSRLTSWLPSLSSGNSFVYPISISRD